MAEEIIYGLVDFGNTVMRLREFWDKYNARVRKEYPETYKAHTLKHSHWPVAEAFIYYYEKHCRQNRNKQLDPKRVFWLTNARIAFRAKTSERTVCRHIKKLLEVGFLACKTFHGTNAASRYIINPKLLVPLNLTEYLGLVPENTVNVKRCFLAGSSAIKTVCQHTASSGLPQDSKKLNMGARSLVLPESSPEQSENVGNTTGLNTTRGLGEMQEGQGSHGMPPRDADRGAASREKDVDNLVASAYMFALQMLYKGRIFSDLEHAHAQSYLKIYYSQAKNLATAHIGFLERITLKRYQMV